MTTFTVPSTRDEILSEIGLTSELHKATGWRLAALLSSVVRLPGTGTRRGERRKSTPFTAKEFAALGYRGLRSDKTVSVYVQRWLDANDGMYLSPGDEYVVPSLDWPPTRTGTDGYESVGGAAATVERLIEKHGADTVADIVTSNPKVNTAISRSRLDKVSTPKGRKDLVDRSRKSEEALEEAVRASHAGLADHTHHEVELELMSVESGLRRAVAKMEQYPYVSDPQRERLAEAFERVELFLGILRKGAEGMTDADRDFLATAGIES